MIYIIEVRWKINTSHTYQSNLFTGIISLDVFIKVVFQFIPSYMNTLWFLLS